jgi:membrane protein implicated in regulation of membrane protease activity
MAGEQRRLAHAAKRDSTSMKILSLLGAIFLPATYLASIFGMSFFNMNGDASSWEASPLVWIYFVITIPLTLAIVVAWRWWDRRRERRYAEEDADIEAGIDKMEAQIMATMRKRTMSKVRTWDATTWDVGKQ